MSGGVDIVITGPEITMVRALVSADLSDAFGRDVAIVCNWREQYDEASQPLHLTALRTARGGYIVVVWCMDNALLVECRHNHLPDALAVDLYGVGTLGEQIDTDERANAATMELARLVAHAELPWPPEDDTDTQAWRLAGSLVDRHPAP